jgi:3-methyladenine DNA glycosylase AlkD
VPRVTHPLVAEVRTALEQAGDRGKAPQMQAYMKSAMPFRGVSAPEQRRLWRDIFPRHPFTAAAEWRRVALQLWREATYREERYAAIALTDLRRHAAWRTRAAIPMIEEMIVTGAWWDYVDVLASHHLGDVLRADPARVAPLMRRWARDADLWKRRAAILCQLRFKGDTDLALLYDCVGPNLGDREFFIRKAIGWALRAYAWIDPREVTRYVRAHEAELSPLSRREALKNVGPQRKSSSRTRARSRSI